MTRLLTLALITSATLTGCGIDAPAPGEPGGRSLIPTTAPGPSPFTEVVSRTALSSGTGVGVTIDPDSGTRFALNAMDGMFSHDSAEPVLAASWETLVPADGWDRRPYTDVVAVGGGKFAITVQSDGLLYDSATGETVQHFCYEPGDSGFWMEDFQLTNSVTFNAATQQIVAQPQTYSGIAVDSAIAMWDVEAGGEPVAWFGLPWPDFSAGGIVMESDDVVLLGRSALLFRYRLGQDGEPEPFMDLADFGVHNIMGLSIDPSSGNLLVLDATANELVELRGWR